MLISTSRKPSSKTRVFSKNLSHALNCNYINRGKMSMRELQLKSRDECSDTIALVYEMKGNPSKITFFSNDGELLLAIIGSVMTTKERLNIKTDEISFKSELPELNILKDIFPINKENIKADTKIDNLKYPASTTKENFIYVEKIDETNDDSIEDYEKKIGIIHFYNKFAKDTGLKIYVRKIVS